MVGGSDYAREEVTRKPKKSDLEDLQKAHSPMGEHYLSSIRLFY